MIVMDTHAWLWWASCPERLSEPARTTASREEEVGVSAVSCWEIAMLVERGRLELDRDVLVWLRQALAAPEIVLLPLTPEVSTAAARIGRDVLEDPVDRLIAATALVMASPLVSGDQRMRPVPGLRIVW